MVELLFVRAMRPAGNNLLAMYFYKFENADSEDCLMLLEN